MRISYVAPYVPYDHHPTAGGLFFHHYLEAVASHHSVQLIAPATAENVEAAGRKRSDFDIYLFHVGSRPATLIGRAAGSFPHLPGGLTPGGQVLKGFRRDPEVSSRLRRSDLIEVQWGHYLPLIPSIRSAVPSTVPLTALAYDVITQAAERRKTAARSANERLRWRLDLPRVRRREVRMLNRCAAVFVMSDKDRVLLRGLGVRGAIEVLDPYIEVEEESGRQVDGRILFVGSFGRPENWEGALWFLENVWPIVAERNSEAEFVVAGADPPEILTERRSPRVIVTGWVDDLGPYFGGASVFVAPLFSGAGLKFKVPQAMLYGLPVVATPVAAEGIVELSGPEKFAAVTSSPGQMADAICALLDDRQGAREIGRRGREWALGAYSFDRTVQTALDTYSRLSDTNQAATFDEGR